MRRRDLSLLLLGGAAGLWQSVGWTQQSPTPVIGFLHPNPRVSSERFVAAFRRGLSEAGLIEGQNVAIDYRWADGRFDRLPELASDLARQHVNAIVTPGSTEAALAAKAVTATIPIVFGISEDPVKLGLVASFSHPGGNATGINYRTVELVAKRLQLFHELVPGAIRLAVLVNPSNRSNAEATLAAAQSAAHAMGLRIRRVEASTGSQIDMVFQTLSQDQPGGLFVAPDSFFNSRRFQLADLAARAAIATSFAVRDYVEAGGLMSYGVSIEGMFQDVGAYTGRVVEGENPADLPVMQPAKFELVINLKTAKALGITVPPIMLAQADEVVE
jgi:putative ABC transport system substrate-binding protein